MALVPRHASDIPRVSRHLSAGKRSGNAGDTVNIVFFGLTVFTLMRFDLLAVAAAIFVAVLVSQLPLNADLSVWYARDAASTILFTVALAVFGFRAALAGQPLFKTE